MNKFRTLNEEEIDVRVGQCMRTPRFEGVTLLLYKNARVDMDVLDETVGAENWCREHKVVNGNMYCAVGIWDDKKGQWVYKEDCGTESKTEKEKGESSDAFKRACVNWGIGRELYTAPQIFASVPLSADGKAPAKKTKFFVSHIAYDDKRRISELEVCMQQGKEVNTVFVYPR